MLAVHELSKILLRKAGGKIALEETWAQTVGYY
jgi:hypothetical protein